MKLAMILGKQQGDAIKPRLQNIKDNLDIDVFDTVQEFVYSVSKRNTVYDRILVLSTKISPTTLKDLNACWSMYSRETAVVMLSRKDSDEAKAKAFLDTFKTPMACAMMVSNTTVSIIAEAVLRPASELNNDYGYKDFLAVELDEDEFVPPEPVAPPKPPVPPVQQTAPTQPTQQPAKPQQKKKRGGGFLSGIFGSRGGSEEEAQEAQQPEQSPVQQPQQPIQQQPQQQRRQPQQQRQRVPQQQPVQQQPVDDWASQDSDDLADWEPDTQDVPPVQQSGRQFPNAGQGQASTVGDYKDDWPDMGDDVDDVEPFQDDDIPPQSARQPMPQPQAPMQPRQPQGRPQQNRNVPPVQSSSEVDVTFDDTFADVPDADDDFSPDAATADADFGEDGILQQTQTASPRQPSGNVQQADESFEDVSIAVEEAQYRKQKEAPRVITKTVREPILGSGSALKGVTSGRLKKVVIVTGDRGTGITSTALSLANAFAKSVEVLYFDCDTRNHGLLNYIDYSTFNQYEQINMEGVKVCKSAQVFERCIIPWDENLSILSSDFSCDCDDESLTQTAQTVSECSDTFGVVVVDCPADKLHCVTDLLMVGNTVLCVEGSKRGFMNMLCQMEAVDINPRFKRNMVSRGNMFITKMSPKVDMKRLLAYIKSIYEPDAVDWMSLRMTQFNGKLSDALLNQILEG